METTERMERVYHECKTIGLRAVAKQLGIDWHQLVAELHRAGVRQSEGCPSQREIEERCRDVRRSGTDERPGCGWDAAPGRAAG